MKKIIIGALLLIGCAMAPTRTASLSRLHEGNLMSRLAGCGPDNHMCRCDAVVKARKECLADGLELHCADDWTETNRGELGCR